MDGRDIALQRAVALHGDKAPLCAQALSLVLDDLMMAGVELGDDHGHVGSAPVLLVVGDDRALELCVGLLKGHYLLGLHIHGAEHEVHQRDHLLHIGLCVQDRQLRHILGDGLLHGPAARHGLLIGLAGGPAACGKGGDLEPGVVL